MANPHFTGNNAVIALWYDGTDWHELKRLNDYGENNYKLVDNYVAETFYLPAGASDNPAFRLRFRVNSIGSTPAAFLDNVFIRGLKL